MIWLPRAETERAHNESTLFNFLNNILEQFKSKKTIIIHSQRY